MIFNRGLQPNMSATAFNISTIYCGVNLDRDVSFIRSLYDIDDPPSRIHGVGGYSITGTIQKDGYFLNISDGKKTMEEDNGRTVKEALLDAAMRLLSSSGREGATMRAICAEVGVTPPTLYHHYGDLNRLHKLAIDEAYRQVADAYNRGYSGAKAKGPLQGIKDGWATTIRFAGEQPNMCRMVVQQMLAGESPSLLASTLADLANELAQFHALGMLKLPPEEAAQLLWMSFLGAICFTVSGQANANEAARALPDAMIDLMLKALFQGEGKKP